MLTRATNRVQSRYNMRSATKGISLLSSFPYTRLTSYEVVELFKAYHIALGCGNLDAEHIISELTQLDRQAFDTLIMQAFSVMRAQGSEHRLAIVRNEHG